MPRTREWRRQQTSRWVSRRWQVRHSVVGWVADRRPELWPTLAELAEPHRFHKHNLQCFGRCPCCHDRFSRRRALRPAVGRSWLPIEPEELTALAPRLLARTRPRQTVWPML